MFPLHRKSEAYTVFLNCKSQVEDLLSMKIKRFRSDGCAECMCFKFQNLLRNSGIVHQVSSPYKQNGCAGCKHRHFLDTGVTMLFNASMPVWLGWCLFNSHISHQSNAHAFTSFLHGGNYSIRNLTIQLWKCLAALVICCWGHTVSINLILVPRSVYSLNRHSHKCHRCFGCFYRQSVCFYSITSVCLAPCCVWWEIFLLSPDSSHHSTIFFTWTRFISNRRLVLSLSSSGFYK